MESEPGQSRDCAAWLARLGEDGLAEWPGFLGPAALEETLGDFERARESGALRPAAVGRGQDRALRADERRDEILWLEPETPARSALLGRVEELRLALNRGLFLGLERFEGHYACYPPGVSIAGTGTLSAGKTKARVRPRATGRAWFPWCFISIPPGTPAMAASCAFIPRPAGIAISLPREASWSVF